MEDKLNELIRENLPQQVGEQLKKELEDLKNLRQSIKDKDDLINSQKNEMDTLLALKLTQEKLDQREQALNIREEQIRTNEFLLEKELTYVTAKKESLVERNNDIFTLVNSLTRNTSFRKTVFENNMDCNAGFTDMNGTYHPPKNETKNTTETVEQA